MPSVADHPMRRVTEAVTNDPGSWGTMKDEVRRTFDDLAGAWEDRLGPTQLTALAAGLRYVPEPLAAIDLACGTGLAADLVAGTFPDAFVVGADLSEPMVRAGVAKPRPHEVRFVVGDASGLPFPDQRFELVTMLNAFVFADELARILCPGGSAVIAYSAGESTPIYIPYADLERLLTSAGLVDLRHGRAGPGTWTFARIPDSTRR
jgi:demethylmenaquinone methyltransferase/2-methoxy-6-polyprenyl-1,4-benzoquinol methylase